MEPSSPILFYDMGSAPPTRSFAPNPWKTRYALNYKTVNFKTEWVDHPDVTPTRKRLGAAPNRVNADGSDFYTLPVIVDGANTIGDSFDIAVYLDTKYPDLPRLIPPHSIGVQKAFNVQVDALFTAYSPLTIHHMPLNPATAEKSKQIFATRDMTTWEEMGVVGDELRKETWAKFKAASAEFVDEVYAYCNKTATDDAGKGPFLEGNRVSYADMTVGAWLQYYRESTTEQEWKDMCEWHGGLWGKLHEALLKYSEMK